MARNINKATYPGKIRWSIVSCVCLTGWAYYTMCKSPISHADSAGATISSVEQHSPEWWKQRFKNHFESISNAEKLHILFLRYAEQHKGRLPKSDRWEKDLAILAKKQHVNLRAIVQRPLVGHPRRFVMNADASELDTRLLAAGKAEDFVLFFENPISTRHGSEGAQVHLANSSKVPDGGCKVVAFWGRSVESTCGPRTPSFGPYIKSAEWQYLVRKSQIVTQSLLRRQREKKGPPKR